MNKLSKFLLKQAIRQGLMVVEKQLDDHDEPKSKKRLKRESKPKRQSKEKPKRQPRQKTSRPPSADQKSSDPKSEFYGKKKRRKR